MTFGGGGTFATCKFVEEVLVLRGSSSIVRFRKNNISNGMSYKVMHAVRVVITKDSLARELRVDTWRSGTSWDRLSRGRGFEPHCVLTIFPVILVPVTLQILIKNLKIATTREPKNSTPSVSCVPNRYNDLFRHRAVSCERRRFINFLKIILFSGKQNK